MAEYAGLEIRIGGSTTKLTNALKASTKSAAELQSRIRQATRAMQFDPTDLKNVETRIRITGDRMQSLQSKAQIAKTAMEQLGDSTVMLGGKEKSVRKVASETENLSLKAKQADERFNGMRDTLAEIYEAWTKKSRATGVDFARDQLNIDAKTAEYLMSTTTSMRDFRTELNNINRARQSGMDFGPIIEPEQLATLTKLKELNFHGMFKNGLGLDEVVKDARDLGVALEDSAIANVRELQKVFKDAQQDKKAFDKALQFEQMGTDAQRLDSEIESLSQTMRGLDDSITATSMTDEFQAIESQVRKVDAALDNVEHDMERAGEAMKVDPGNIELAKRYFDDLQQKAALSEEKVGLLQQEMDMLNANGAKEAAESHQDLAKWIEESAESARTAKKELSDQKASVTNLEDQVKSLSQRIASMKGDTTLAEYSDNVRQWKTRTEQLAQAMDKLRVAASEASTQQKKVGEAQDALDKAKENASDYRKRLRELKSEYKQLETAAEDAFNGGEVIPPETFARMADLENEIRETETAYGGAKQEVKELGKELRNQQKNADSAQKSLSKQKEAVSDLKKSISDLEKTDDVKLFKNPTGEIDKANGELKRLQGELDRAKAKENELEDAYDSAKTENELAKTAQAARDLGQDLDDAKTKAKEAADAVKPSQDSIFNPSTIKSIGMTLSATVTPAVAALGYKMVDASSTVDSAYRDMRKTVNGTEEQFEQLRSAAIDFSRTHVTSADQILQIEAIGGELGIATSSLETFAEVISNIDVASNLDTEDAATALGHLANIMHLSEEDYVGFSDALVRLGNNGASTESEIVNIAERIGSMASIVGMSASDTLAFASSIASTGQNAEAAGTAISKTLSFMETAVSAAGGTMDTSFEAINAAVEEGGDKLTVFASLAGMTADEFSESWATNSEEMASELNEQLDSAKDSLQMIADVAHMSADEFAQTWESDPTEAVKAFINGLNDIEGAGGSADKVLQDLGITSVRQKQAIEGLMQTVGGLDDNLRMSEDAWNGISDKWGEAGDAANEAAKKAEGFSGQMQILRNIGQNFLAELGEGAAPWIQRFSGILQGVSGWFSTLGKGSKEAIVALGGLAAALGPTLSFAGTLGTMRNDFNTWAATAVSGVEAVKAAFDAEGQAGVNAMAGTVSGMQKVKLVGAALGKTLLKGLAVGAVLAGIALIATELKKLYDRYQDHIAATSGLSSALANVGRASDDAVVGLDRQELSLSTLAADADQYESRLADLAKTIEDSNKQYGTYAGQMDYYAGVIEDLGGKAKRSEDEAYKLEAALQAVNDACGTTYGLDEYGNIIDTETGKIQKNTDEILANIDARKMQALIDYYSDDYAKAVGENAEAQDKLNQATEKYEDLISDSGRQKYFEDAKKVYGKQYDEMVESGRIQDAYEESVRRAKETVGKYEREVEKTGETVETVGNKIGAAEEKVKKANKALEEAAKAQEELDRRTETVAADVTGNMKRMSDAAETLGTSDENFNRMVEGLDAIHVTAEEMNDVDMSSLVSSFDSAGGSMEQIIATLENGGVVMSTWNAALEQAPGAAEKMGSITAAAFQSMYDSAGQNLNATMTLIAGLDTVMAEVDGRQVTFYIGDNGSITDSQGKVYDIKEDLGSIPDEVITAYYVDDSDALQKALDAKAELAEVEGSNPTATISVVDNASAPAETLKGTLGSLSGLNPSPVVGLVDNASAPGEALKARLDSLGAQKPTPVAALSDKASGPTQDLQGKLNAVGGMRPTPSAYLNDYASGGLASISTRLTNLNGRNATITVTTVERTVKQATGGLNNRPVIPRHATGYIATGPTLTNQGWIGEDGVEAVANWATGGAVVPLTNKKYMLPIADAIAEGMAARGAGYGTVNNFYVNDAVVNGDAEIQAAFLDLFDTLARKGAMNRGRAS